MVRSNPQSFPYSSQRKDRVDNTISRGINTHSRQLLAAPCFEAYQNIFDKFLLPPKVRAAVLGSVYPFESFLNKDGK